MCAEVESLREDDDVAQGSAEEHGQGERGQQAAGQQDAVQANARVIEPQHDQPDRAEGEHGGGGGLGEGAKEGLVEQAELAASDQAAERGGLGVHPGDGHGGQGATDVEAHAHLAGLDRAAVIHQQGVEELRGNVAGEPGDGDAPLKRPDFVAPIDVKGTYDVAQQGAQEASLRPQQPGTHHGLAEDHAAWREEAAVQQKSAPAERGAQQRLPQTGASDLRNITATFEEAEERVDLKGEARGDDHQQPGQDKMYLVAAGTRGGVAKKGDPERNQGQCHQDGGDGVPANGFLQHAGQTAVRLRGAGDRAVGSDVQVGGFV